MQSKAHLRATQKYERKAYDKILIRLRKDSEPTKETITAAAAASGLSLNAFIVEAINDRLQSGPAADNI